MWNILPQGYRRKKKIKNYIDVHFQKHLYGMSVKGGRFSGDMELGQSATICRDSSGNAQWPPSVR